VHDARRKRFLEAIGQAAVVLPAAPVRNRSNDVDHEYRQDSDFHYLTGFPEPEAVAVLSNVHPEHRYVLFVRPRDREKETWNGRRAGEEGAVATYGADASFPIDRLDELLPRYVENVPRLYYRLGRDRAFDDRMLGALDKVRAAVRTGVTAPDEIVDPARILHEMRLIKSPEDQHLLREACRISSEAHVAAMRSCRPGMNEHELEAIVEFIFRRSGAAGPGYPSIVGAGANATILHYTENNCIAREGDLVLIDAGCEYQGFNADITRTFPAGGVFSKPQREIYELVLDAQKQAIEEVRPGALFEAYHERAVRVLVEGLLRIGLLQGAADELIASEGYKRFYMHRTGHWLGADVHDVGRYKLNGVSRKLEPGMVLTVEPGLYIAEDDETVPAAYRGIGVRIEDDVLVTAGGREILTAGAPKTITEIEATMSLGAPALL
jgi:Xaa-Pro aminopeptidase